MKNFDLPNALLIQSIEHSNLAHTISRIDGDMELLYVNQAFFDTTGYTREESIGRNCRFLQGTGTDPDTVQKIRKALSELKPLDIEILNYKKDGTPFWNRLRMAPVYDDQNKPIAFIGIQSDITAMKEKARIDQKRQKLEALGRMTGNISHEIKNTLQPVKLMADVLKDWKNLDEAQIERCIKILNDNINLADHVVQDVLRFSRKSDNNPEKIATKILKDEVISFVRNLLHSRIDYKIETNDQTENDHHVAININSLCQILMNIVNNALYAMEDKGQLTLNWDYKEIDSSSALSLGLNEGAYLCIGIKDSGCGMDEKTIRSAFDPFFSTKPPGEGTGLGLSISYRIVKEWNGTIHIESQLNAGSVFTIYLPIIK